MGFRFRRSIRLFPGVRLNIGKRGVSLSAGVRGAHVTVSEHGTRTTVGVPGTGLSYTDYQRHDAPSARDESTPYEDAERSKTSPIVVVLAILLVIALLVLAAS